MPTASTVRSLSLVVFLILMHASDLLAFDNVPTETDSAMGYLEVLADPDTFEGRKTGTELGNASQRWIADHFESWGLQPFVGESLLHEFDMLVTEEKRAHLTLMDDPRYGDLDLLLGTDYTLTVNSGSAKVEAPVVFVGHGISKPDKGWDDYEGRDVSGKIVVITRGRPANGENWDDEYSRSYLLPTAIEHGAVGVLFYMGAKVIGGAAIMEKAYSEAVPSAVIGDRVVDLLLHGTGFTFNVYKRVLKQGPRVLETGRTMRIDAKVKRIEPGIGLNVVGLVPGTDPELANEIVLIGGHGDHVGPNSQGQIYAGADDNGSGTCVVMELARNFAQHPQPRPIVFMLFGAEEQGLLGSEAIVSDLPDEYEYVTMLNLDMAGRGEGVTGIGGGNAIPNVWFPFYDALDDSVRGTIEARRAWGGYNSDHAPFRKAGVPAFTCYSKGSHDHYHRSDDLYETIDHRAIGGALNGMARWLSAVASFPTPLADPYQAQRVAWHQGYGIAHGELTGEVAADIADAINRNHDGYVASVLLTDAPDGDAEQELFIDLLDRYGDAITAQKSAMDLADELKGFRGAAYGMRASVYLGVNGDHLSDADTTHMQLWSALGMSLVKLSDQQQWVNDEELKADKAALCATWKDLETVVEMPLAGARYWLPVASEVNSPLFVGSFADWTQTSSATREMIRESGAAVVLMVEAKDLRQAVDDREALHTYRVHVQPASDDYRETLAWVRMALEMGLEADELQEWIGGNTGRW